uniref:Vespid chemotactic peptide T n=1 Tax=Vespa tropica TaxID=7450 RepID=CRBL_VESTR|nr:RecName: Full=Vespid chemotactic peptide T; Short=VESCP-T; Short=Ves-CP-T [Vespa tropica]
FLPILGKILGGLL